MNMPSEPCRCGHSRTRGERAVRTLDRHGLQFGSMLDQRVARGVRLGARERADRVDEPAARAQPVGRRGRDRHLEPREGRELGPPRPPEQLGPPARRPDAASTARPRAPGRTSRRAPVACRPAPRRARGRGAVPRCSARGPPVRVGRPRRRPVRSRRPGTRRAPPCRPAPRRRRARGRPVADRARATTNADAWSCTANQPCAKPRRRAGSPPSRSTQSGWSCAGRGLVAARAEPSDERVDRGRRTCSRGG